MSFLEYLTRWSRPTTSRSLYIPPLGLETFRFLKNGGFLSGITAVNGLLLFGVSAARMFDVIRSLQAAAGEQRQQ